MPDQTNAAGQTDAAGGTDAASRARATRVAVIGASLAGLVAGLEWAKVGAQVTVFEAQERLGGEIETVTLDGVNVALGPDVFDPSAETMRTLLDTLELTGEVETPTPLPLWVGGSSVASSGPLPAHTILGVPANAWSEDVRRLIGWRGAWRAYLDRLRPPLTIGHERSLDRLVRTRMGDRVVDRLVAPSVRAEFGAEPPHIDVDLAAPGLSAALTRTGSLAGAVSALLPVSAESPRSSERSPSDAAAQPARARLRGGLDALIDALAARLDLLGAEICLGTRIGALTRGEAWELTTEVPAADEGDDGTEERDAMLTADVVIVATGAHDAALLVPELSWAATPAHPERDIVTFLVDAPALDGAPRGRGVVDGDADSVVMAVAHLTAEWPSLATAASRNSSVTHPQLVRAVMAVDPARSDPDTVSAAIEGAAALFGMPLPAPIAQVRRRVLTSPPAVSLGHAEHTAQVRAGIAADGLAVVGGWLGGAAVADLVADTVAEVDRLRSDVLWAGDQAPSGADTSE